MSGLKAAANRPNHPFQPGEISQALRDAEAFEISIEATPWGDVRRAWALAEGSLRYADAIYVAVAERHETALLTADGRIARSGAQVGCEIITVNPGDDYSPGSPHAATPTQRGSSFGNVHG